MVGVPGAVGTNRSEPALDDAVDAQGWLPLPHAAPLVPSWLTPKPASSADAFWTSSPAKQAAATSQTIHHPRAGADGAAGDASTVLISAGRWTG